MSLWEPTVARKPLFTVVIPACNRPDLLAKALESLRPEVQGISPDAYEVVVTDDSCNGEVLRLIEQRFPWVRWLQGPQRGPAANRNHGAQAAHGDWLVFMDDDCIASPQLLSVYRAHLGQGMVLEGRTIPLGARTRCDEECPANETGGYLWSCNMAIDRQLFHELRGFDEAYPSPAMEDVDFCCRVLGSGIQPVFLSGASVYHPWRVIRGIDAMAMRAKAMGIFLRRHPEKRGDYSLPRQLINFLRVIKRILQDGVRYKGHGFLRYLSLQVVGMVLQAREIMRVPRQ